ncbi:MAG: hypothetical protein AAGF94_01470 [Pseudomonadota bacterium]
MDEHDTMPWHHGFVSFIALVFYVAMAVGYVLIQFDVPLLTQEMHPDALAVMKSLPDWVAITWAIFTWLGLLGAIVLWFRGALAPAPLFIAFVAYVTLALWLELCGRPKFNDYYGVEGYYWLGGVGLVSLLVYVYSRWERAKGMLG